MVWFTSILIVANVFGFVFSLLNIFTFLALVVLTTNGEDVVELYGERAVVRVVGNLKISCIFFIVSIANIVHLVMAGING